MVANHTPILICIMRPHRQHFMNALIVMSQHRINHITITLWLDDVEKRMECSISIPQRECGIIGKVFSQVNILV
ncbi:hypothetical protein D3C72_566470 [compost metagenome]